MAELIVLAYDKEQDAEGAYRAVQALQQDLVVELAGLALVHTDDDGRTRVETPGKSQRIGAAAVSGAIFGAVIGLLFFVPVVGFVAGGALGALFSTLDATGMNAQFRRRVKEEVTDGRSAVVVYATKVTADKFGEALAPFGGSVVRTSLSDEDERTLVQDLAESR